jgi:hypothetical protein
MNHEHFVSPTHTTIIHFVGWSREVCAHDLKFVRAVARSVSSAGIVTVSVCCPILHKLCHHHCLYCKVLPCMPSGLLLERDRLWWVHPVGQNKSGSSDEMHTTFSPVRRNMACSGSSSNKGCIRGRYNPESNVPARNYCLEIQHQLNNPILSGFQMPCKISIQFLVWHPVIYWIIHIDSGLYILILDFSRNW